LRKEIEDGAKQLSIACERETKKEIEETKMVEVMESVDLIRKMKKFQKEKDKNPVFEVFRCYMQIIMVWI